MPIRRIGRLDTRFGGSEVSRSKGRAALSTITPVHVVGCPLQNPFTVGQVCVNLGVYWTRRSRQSLCATISASIRIINGQVLYLFAVPVEVPGQCTVDTLPFRSLLATDLSHDSTNKVEVEAKVRYRQSEAQGRRSLNCGQ
jgi:hypothetical protein